MAIIAGIDGLLNDMDMYFVSNLDSEGYKRVLSTLEKTCSSFYLVESSFYPKHPNSIMPAPKNVLNKWLITSKRVISWAGTKISAKRRDQKAIQHVYKCCHGSIQVLMQYDSFFSYEDNMDIAFFDNDRCVLYTRPLDEVIVADMDYLADTLRTIRCGYRKIHNFVMIL